MSYSDVLAKWEDESDFYEIRTSGSTGKPKLIRLEKDRMEVSARKSLNYFGLVKGDPVLLALPTDKVGGVMLCVRAIIGGLKVVEVEPRLNPLRNIDLREKIHFCSLAPAQLQAILGDGHSRSQLKKVEKILLGGSAISPKLAEIIPQLDAKCYHSYGMTETISHVAVRNMSEGEEYFTALDGVSFRTNAEGQLMITAPGILGEELVTNDLVELDGTQKMKWLGRADNVVNSGGVKIVIEEVERKLRSMYNGDFYLVKGSDPQFGERLVMVSLLDITDDDLTDLEKLERPREVFVTKQFHYTSNGKLLRLTPQQLRDL